MPCTNIVPDNGKKMRNNPDEAAACAETQRFWRCTELPFVETRCARDSAACYVPHTHNHLSIGAVDAGCSEFSSNLGTRRLAAGEVVLIPPQVVHACNPLPEAPWGYQMLYLDPDWVERTLGQSVRLDTMVITDLPAQTFACPVYRALTALNRNLFSNEDVLEKETQLVRFVGDVLSPLVDATPDALPCAAAAEIDEVRALIEARCTETLRLADLAAVAGLSPYHFVRAFRARVGMTPHAWQLDARIRRARVLLDQGMALADLALTLGFADQSHFQRAFRQRVAVTPRQYRQTAPRNFVQD